ncbi:MAG: hypothetical protein KAU31_01690 [Spirochaetaceae bacterium]|nr:hypothetical protein [Spirochaetaceae bacterium]
MAFTYFFRDWHTLNLITEHVLPYIRGRSKIRFWDAGCAMGPEPYSLAIVFAEKLGRFEFRNLQIHATDIDESGFFGEIISEGVYPEEELSRIPGNLFEKYFAPNGKPGSWKITDAVRTCVHYQTHDLLSLEPVGGGFSLILCKNVLLHFHARQRLDVLRMFHRSLAPGGFLAMEQTQKLPEELSDLFEQMTPDGQVFRKAEVEK